MARTAHHAPHALLALRRGGRARARGGGRAGERRRGAAPGARNVPEPEAAAIVREKI